MALEAFSKLDKSSDLIDNHSNRVHESHFPPNGGS